MHSFALAEGCGCAPPFPAVDGPHRIGTVAFEVVDESRADPFDAEERRALMVQAWYPTKDEGEGSTYENPMVGPLTDYMARHLDVEVDASLSDDEDTWPVIFSSPGYFDSRFNHQGVVHPLVSQGYVVFALDHPGWARSVEFPDGRVVGTDQEHKDEILKAGRENDVRPAAADTVVWVQDLLAVLAHLRGLEDDGSVEARFAGRVDLSRVGAFGQSFGGMTSATAALADDGIVATMSMDSPAGVRVDELDEPADGFTYLGDGGLVQPHLHFAADPETACKDDDEFCPVWHDRAHEQWRQQLDERGEAGGDGYRVEIAGTRHENFGDVSVAHDLARFGGSVGPADGIRVLEIIARYSTAFFDRHLKGEGGDLLDEEPSSFEEATFDRWPQ